MQTEGYNVVIKGLGISRYSEDGFKVAKNHKSGNELKIPGTDKTFPNLLSAMNGTIRLSILAKNIDNENQDIKARFVGLWELRRDAIIQLSRGFDLSDYYLMYSKKNNQAIVVSVPYEINKSDKDSRYIKGDKSCVIRTMENPIFYDIYSDKIDKSAIEDPRSGMSCGPKLEDFSYECIKSSDFRENIGKNGETLLMTGKSDDFLDIVTISKSQGIAWVLGLASNAVVRGLEIHITDFTPVNSSNLNNK